MADEEHVALLTQDVDAWNAWRRENMGVRPDLREADLSGARLSGADLLRANLGGANLGGAHLSGARLSEAELGEADLRGAVLGGAHLSGADLRDAELGGADLRGADFIEANLRRAHLGRADLRGAKLIEADLGRADLREANLGGADLREANLGGAHLGGANLSEATLGGANLGGATLHKTIFGDTNFAGATGLETCRHVGPSILDHQTLQKSGPLPLAFLRGVGLPETLIEYLPSLLNQPIQFYSCFISYSGKDQEFAERLHVDLQSKGVRCWFAPHDMPIGAKILDALDEAIRLRDKVLLILSENAIASDWVEGEVTRALDEERTRKQVVLFPVRIDDAVVQTSEAWARLLRGQRNIGDFTRWKDHDSYRKSFERVLRDLKVSQEQAPKS
jgi:uncharacterized protein YjbI with pentapeptide repeats